MSGDAHRALFETPEQIAATDHDGVFDFYRRAGARTKLLSGWGRRLGHQSPMFLGASANAARIFFSTEGRLIHGDRDSAPDIYAASGGRPHLVSRLADPDDDRPPRLEALSPGGRVVVYSQSSTVYVARGRRTAVLPRPADFADATPDDRTIFFTTEASFDPADDDSCTDVYGYRAGATWLISAAGSPATSDDASFDGASADGSRVLFSTREALPPAAAEQPDSDQALDIYQREGATTTRLSTGEDSGNAELGSVFRAASRDGSHVLFETREALVPADRDGAVDVYDCAGGVTNLITNSSRGRHAAHLRAISEDGKRVIFVSRDPMTRNDHDRGWDLYGNTGGKISLVSRGSDGGHPAVFQAATANASHVFFRTLGTLVSADRDQDYDVYDATASRLRLVSTS
ncbi:MAG: hypothetical protein QOJ38_1715 [Solirubrobacterales bacterium]|nr:hypothetical protein [Solirubrobacterales bacterium]